MAEISFEERQKIFAKEAMSIKDLQSLLDISYSGAAQLMTKIKDKLRLKKQLRLDIRGKLLLKDYFEYFGIDPNQSRYFPNGCETDEFYLERLEALHGHAEQ